MKYQYRGWTFEAFSKKELLSKIRAIDQEFETADMIQKLIDNKSVVVLSDDGTSNE